MNTCNANQAAEKIVGQLEEGQMMAQNENRSPWWVSAVQTLGVVTVAFFLLFKSFLFLFQSIKFCLIGVDTFVNRRFKIFLSAFKNF